MNSMRSIIAPRLLCVSAMLLSGLSERAMGR
jgi:hypothetical protein